MNNIKRFFLFPLFLAFTLTVLSQVDSSKKTGRMYNPDGIELVYVAGSDSGIHARKGFYIGKYEITQDEWETVMGGNPSRFKDKRNPVEMVSWNDVQVFLKKLNEKTGRSYRLPTESEWEYAAKGGFNNDAYIYAGSNNLNEVAWWFYNSDRTHTVGTGKPNSLGIYDMTGNVFEWCSDCYDVTDSGSDCLRVSRGGSWYSSTQDCRLDYRCGRSPGYCYNIIGFRVALP